MNAYFFRGAERRIFQAQLFALLDRGDSFMEAIEKINERADPRLSALLSRSRQGRKTHEALLAGLREESLLHPDLAAALVESTDGICSEVALRAHIRQEAAASLVHQQVQRHIGRVFWFLALMSVFCFAIYGSYQARVIPLLRESTNAAETPLSMKATLITVAATVVMALFLAVLGSIYLALKLEAPRQWRLFRFLWLIPGPAGFFRKQATWRILSRARFLLEAGITPAKAFESSLAPFGVSLRNVDGVALLPEGPLLDPATVRAVNLAASLNTLQAQLAFSVDFLQADLPYAAQTAARAVYYAGYLVLAVLVASLLVRMYDPLFSYALYL